MKKILIVESELHDLYDDGLIKNPRIIIKKNKTIIKDRKYFTEHFLNLMDRQEISKKFFIEEWEVANKDRVQIIMSNNGNPLRAVHIIDSLNPKKGVKALFQSEKMLILKMQNGKWEFTKNFIDDKGNISCTVISIGSYTSLFDIRKSVEPIYRPAVDSIMKNYNKFINEGYYSPIWSECGL